MFRTRLIAGNSDENQTISSQAWKQEGSTARGYSRTRKATWKRRASRTDEDMVSSAWRHAAARDGGAGVASLLEDKLTEL